MTTKTTTDFSALGARVETLVQSYAQQKQVLEADVLPVIRSVAELQAAAAALTARIEKLRTDERKAQHEYEVARAEADVFMGEYRRRRAELDGKLRADEKAAAGRPAA